MDPHRKGNAFDANVPGDQRLHDAINRRTPQAAGMQVTHMHSGTIASAKKRNIVETPFPFQWYIRTPGTIHAAPGVFVGESFSGLSQAVTTTLDETWYLYGELEFNTTTGAVIAKDVYWSTDVLESDFDTGFGYISIATVTIIGGVIDTEFSFNSLYGPVRAIICGGINSKWEVVFI